MDGATYALAPTDSMPPSVGRTKPDTQQITADASKPVRRRSVTPKRADGLVPYDSDAQVPTDEPGHAATDTQSSGAALDRVGRVEADAQMDRASPDQVGQAAIDAHEYRADLDLLHAALGHYARQLWDIQKVRIAMANRVAAMERDDLPEHLIAHARTTAEGLARLESDINRYLERSARRHPLADWIKAQRGIGLPGFARLLGITGPLDRFATVSKLWAYLGMHVVEGEAPKRRKGERANWSPQGRVLCHQIGDSIVKVGAGGPYRAAYDRKKGEYETDRPEWTQARRHNAAMRYAVKELLKALWIEWRRAQRLVVGR